MTTLSTSNLQPPTNGSPNPDSPVPLDTIPISPADGSSFGQTDGTDDPKREYGEDEQITVFHDANNFNVKHPLMHTWTLWFTKPPSGKVCRSYISL